jgi:hypothetical protein
VHADEAGRTGNKNKLSQNISLSGGAPMPPPLRTPCRRLHPADNVSCSIGEKMPRLCHGKTALQQARPAAERRRECGSTAR